MLSDFLAHISTEKLTETDEAVAVLWFLSQTEARVERSARDLAAVLTEHRLRGVINVSRLDGRIAKHPDTVRGRGAGSFAIKASAKAKLDARFAAFASRTMRPVRDVIVPNSISLGNRGHLEAIRREINGTFEDGFYNSCAVMCRRLLELLLIEAFARASAIQHVTDARGNLVGFADLIAFAKSGVSIKLSRGLPATLDRVKATGDQSAHGRYYTATKHDIDDLNPGLRHAITELTALAGIA